MFHTTVLAIFASTPSTKAKSTKSKSTSTRQSVQLNRRLQVMLPEKVHPGHVEK
jgi:hypothetical protein